MTNDVTRWDLVDQGDTTLTQRPDGDYVKWEDFQAVRAALLDLYNGTAEYVYLNNLGDPHNTTPMRRASEVLGVAYPRSMKSAHEPIENVVRDPDWRADQERKAAEKSSAPSCPSVRDHIWQGNPEFCARCKVMRLP